MSSTRNHKKESLNKQILELLPESLQSPGKQLLYDNEIEARQDYANTVSIKRLGFNDHGDVHMRIVVLNALRMAMLLRDAEIPLHLEQEGIGSFEDSLFVLLIAGLFHDIGMGITRSMHEHFSAWMMQDNIRELCRTYVASNLYKQVALETMVYECIVGHMGTIQAHSYESGLILIADGCDIGQGRARIPMLIDTPSKRGDIHKYSALAIGNVEISSGDQSPILITVYTKESAGFFQIEEVLLPKLAMSSARNFCRVQAIYNNESKEYIL